LRNISFLRLCGIKNFEDLNFHNYLLFGSMTHSLMDLTNKYELSLGREPYDVLGFDSEDQLNHEITKLIQLRPEFDNHNNISEEN